MAKVKIEGNASGTGTFTIAAPNSNTNRTLEIPDTDGSFVTQTTGYDVSFYEDTGTTAKFFWDASAESLGIGTSSPAVALDVSGGNSLASRAAFTRTDTSSTLEAGAWFTAGPYVGSATNHPLQIITNDTERMRIDSSGILMVNTTSSYDSAQVSIVGNNNTGGTIGLQSPKGSNISHIHYATNGDWYIRPASSSGSVYVLNYQAESDARLKKDILPITYGLNEILQLSPRQFRWKESDDKEVNGFIAQEVEAVIPAIVSEGQWKSIDYQGITAVLVKAMQEQQAIIEALETRIAALEA